MRKFSILILVLIAIVVVTGTAIFTVGTNRTAELESRTFITEDRTEQGIVRAVIDVQSLSYEVFTPEGSTAYDLMVAAASKQDDFSFQGQNFPGIGFFVEEINGLAQDKKSGMYWIYYINGQTAQVGVSQYKLKNNDIITWKYEKEY